MLKPLIFVFIAISGALIWINFGVGVPDVHREELKELVSPHIYNDSSRAIDKIKIFALYFIPVNKAGQQIVSWKEILQENLDKLQKFHDLQFQGRSQLAYEILSQPIIGQKENLDYDTDVTQHGNPEGLRRISAELKERGIIKTAEPGAYQVVLILYEGVGASGSEDVALVSRIFFTDRQYSNVAATTMAHEFYHTLGLPDAYEIPSAIPTSLDIMGLGLSKPLEKNFISREFLEGMGF